MAAFLVVVAVGLGGAWSAQSLAFATGGEAQQLMIDTGSKTPIVFAIGLTLVVPTMLVAGVLLWRRRPWGCMLGVKGVAYATVLLAVAAWQDARGN